MVITELTGRVTDSILRSPMAIRLAQITATADLVVNGVQGMGPRHFLLGQVQGALGELAQYGRSAIAGVDDNQRTKAVEALRPLVESGSSDMTTAQELLLALEPAYIPRPREAHGL